MRHTLPLLGPFALLLLVLLGSCARDDPAERLHGRWELEGVPYRLRIEFLPGGEYRAQTSTGHFVGRWAITAPDRLATWSEETGRPPRLSRFSFEDGALVIQGDAGDRLVHRRIP